MDTIDIPKLYVNLTKLILKLLSSLNQTTFKFTKKKLVGITLVTSVGMISKLYKNTLLQW